MAKKKADGPGKASKDKRDWMDEIEVTGEKLVAEVKKLAADAKVQRIRVIEPDGRLVGALRERDVVGALNRELLRQDALMARVHHGPEHDRQRDFFELPAGYGLATVEAAPLQGGTLKDLDLPRRLGVRVLAGDQWDEQAGPHRRVPAKAALLLGSRDRLVVMGPAEHLEDLSRDELGDIDLTVEVTRELPRDEPTGST